ncbi:MAG: hypothetical protein ACRCTE_04035 [Cellulosilyticaceae bacterium]
MKLRLLAAVVLSLAVFTGCGAKEEAPQTTTPDEITQTEVDVRKVEIPKDKDMIVTEVTFEEGKPVDVQIDIIMENGDSKHEKAAAGEYVMVEGAENTWDKQIDAIEEFIKANNFDLTTITTDENGKTDVVTGVSVSVPDLLTGVEQLLAEAK